jgi:hypothetical protein
VCRPLKEGGSGIKNLRAFNMTPLGKLMWKFKLESVGLWYRALACRYRVGEGVDLGKGGRDYFVRWCEISHLEFVNRDLLDEFSLKVDYQSNMSLP